MSAIILGVIGCVEPEYKETTNSLSKILPATTEDMIVVVIPNQGCTGCISEAESYVMANHQKAPNISYVFTRIQSHKLLKRKLGDSILNRTNVILDEKNYITYPDEEKEIYPMIIYLKKGSIKKVEYQSPTSPGFANLLKSQTTPE